jgi:glutamyl-tRNA synthetase
VSADELEELARRFALQNALDHGGEANQGAVIGRIMSYDEDYKDQPDEVARVAGRIVGRINELDEADQRAELDELGSIEMEAKDSQREGLPELPNAEDGDVVMRFAPNPNGAPSLGHSRGMCINARYADLYDGTLILRFDDTDPVNKPPSRPAYDWFEEEFAWLGADVDRVLRASDRMEAYDDCAETAIEIEAAYACECTPEQFREHKQAGEACPHRGDPVDEQMARWERMRAGEYEPGDCVLRIKTDMSHDDPALRDWVAFRLVDVDEHPHCRVGDDYHVWPLLDFQSAVDDYREGTTHIIRGKDLADSERKQRFLYEHFGWEYPEVLHWGRVAMHEFGTFSTSTMQADIAAGKYDGWDDPRLPTLKALRRRGFLPEAIMSFWVDLGLTEKDIDVSFETLAAENRKLLDEEADRLFFVPDPVAIEIEDLEEPIEAEVPVHPDDEDRGTRSMRIEDDVLVPGEEVADLEEGTRFRLKDGLDATWLGDGRARFESRMPGEERDGPIVQWAPVDSPEASVLRPDASYEHGVVEPAAFDHRSGDVVQFERYGFARIESLADEELEAVFGHR